MSPVAADCASANSASGELAELVVGDVDAAVAVGSEVPVEAALAEVDEERLEDPQPAATIADASTTPRTESSFIDGRLAI
jgi:hypothetical protein